MSLRLLALSAVGILLLSTAACTADSEGSEASEADLVAPHGLPGLPPPPPMCGGIAGLQCPAGLECKLDGDYPDASGHCERPTPVFCGGIAGIHCPSGFDCKLDGVYPDAGGHCEKAPVWDVCQVDSDCIAVQAHGCCSFWDKEAVHKDHVAEYDASFDELICAAVACAPAHPDLFAAPEAPLCVAGRCDMVKVKDIACGGHSPNPHHCPANYTCQGAGLPVDAPGKCVQN